MRPFWKVRGALLGGGNRRATTIARGDMKKTHVTQNSGNNEWYTPSRIIDGARHVLGEIDLDPASNMIAQQTVKATCYYTGKSNGLVQPWYGRVWLNPPYARGLIEAFVEKLLDSPKVTAWCVLVNNGTETKWGQKILRNADSVLFFNGRIRFDSPGGEKGKPLQGQMLGYRGPKPLLFGEMFGACGMILRP